MAPAHTNVVYVEIAPEHVEGLRGWLARRGILATVAARTRLMTHMDVSRPKIDEVLSAFREYPFQDSVQGGATPFS